MARIIGAAPNTVRRWLRGDHHDLYWDHWASFMERWRAAQDAQAHLLSHIREANALATKRRSDALMDALNCELERLSIDAVSR